jgi:hypothetical protein
MSVDELKELARIRRMQKESGDPDNVVVDKEDLGVAPTKEHTNQIPGAESGMFFEYYEFDPMTDAFTMQDLINLLRVMEIRLPMESFEKLPDETKRHFMVLTREKKRFRYRKPRRQI